MTIVGYIVVGVLSGVIAGMGMGGGTLLIPALTLLLAVEQHAAQGVNMLAFIPAALIALWIHAKGGRIDIKRCIPMILTGAVGTVLSSLLAGKIEGEWLKKGFGGFLIALSILQAISGEKKFQK
jgi:uncharacterized membrane protein YfcA